jgi:hypothetical protein
MFSFFKFCGFVGSSSKREHRRCDELDGKRTQQRATTKGCKQPHRRLRYANLHTDDGTDHQRRGTQSSDCSGPQHSRIHIDELRFI